MNQVPTPDDLDRDRRELRAQTRRRRSAAVMIALALLAAAAGGGWYGWTRWREGAPAVAAPAAARRDAVPVTLARVERKPMPVVADLVGTVQAIASIPIKARIDSQVTAVKVEEGARVAAGQVLFDLDDRTLKAQLAQAEAQIAKDRAQHDQARRDAERIGGLFQRQIASEVQRDNAATALRSIDAQILLDEANRSNVATGLSYAVIRAPVAGRIGSIAAKVGTVVRQADTAPIAVVNQIDPIYVAFALPQDRLADLRAAMANRTAAVEIASGGDHIAGKIAFIENSVDTASGTIAVRATVENAAETLWPGTFVKVRLVLDVEPLATVVPLAAVQMGQDGPYLFTVDPDGRAHLRQVAVTRTLENEAVVTPALDAATRVVIDGQARLSEGTAVSDGAARPKPALPGKG